ncbi:MAG: hypothetical protein KC731_23845 [Myxococcales bacterium]|nr:hypothetical protein [Myxococcales bacterium]
MSYRSREAAARAQDRRDREDAATRLLSVVPNITSLRLDYRELRDGATLVQYTRLVVVARAPALFEIACSDSDCEDGMHDLTRTILNALRDNRTDFIAEDNCRGHRRDRPCGRLLVVRLLATYDSSLLASSP